MLIIQSGLEKIAQFNAPSFLQPDCSKIMWFPLVRPLAGKLSLSHSYMKKWLTVTDGLVTS